MTFFESLLVLLLAAILLLKLARKVSLPYPAMLAGAGVLIAFIPQAPTFSINPTTSLALFLAPVIADAAYDFPLSATRRFLAPIFAYAVFGVIFTATVVAVLSVLWLHMPLAAGVVLGAIVSAPDAGAATATLRSVRLPLRTDTVLRGESLFNDATALILFGGGLIVLEGRGFTLPVTFRLGFAPLGGILLGCVCAFVVRFANRRLRDTLGGTIFQFVSTYLVWIGAEHLHFSPVLCEIAFAMTLARTTDSRDMDTRMRVQSYAVWSSVVFGLNVFAFLLMGLQTRTIVLRMPASHLHTALILSAITNIVVIAIRFFVVYAFTHLEKRWNADRADYPVATPNQTLFVGWCGMRGFVTVATALALPQSFPHRDSVVLTAFSVVLVTLVLQGITIIPLVKILKLDRGEDAQIEIETIRVTLAESALRTLAGQEGPEAAYWRYHYSLKIPQSTDSSGSSKERFRNLGLKAIEAERITLDELEEQSQADSVTYLDLQEQLDWWELALSRDADRHIEEI